MAQDIDFPLQLTHTFFSKIYFERKPEIPDPLQLFFRVETKTHHEDFPKTLQLDLKIETPNEQPMKVSLELIALFELIEKHPEPDREILSSFLNKRALYMLWPYMVNMIRDITGQMGVNPITIQTPPFFDLQLEENKQEA